MLVGGLQEVTNRSTTHIIVLWLGQSSFVPVQGIQTTLECGPMPNLMVALANIGGALCSTPQSLADAHY